MFKTARMDFISFIVNKSVLNQFLGFLGGAEFIQLVSANNIIDKSDLEKNLDKKNYEKLSLDFDTNFQQLTKMLNIKEQDYKNTNLDYQSVLKYLDDPRQCQNLLDELIESVDNIKNISKSINKIKQEMNNLYDYSRQLMSFENRDFEVKLLKSMKHFAYRFGYILRSDLPKLKESLSEYLYYLNEHSTMNNMVAISVFVLKKNEKNLSNIISNLDFTKIELPLDYQGTLKEVLDEIEIEIWENREKLIELELQINEFKDKKKRFFAIIFMLIKYLRLVNKCYHQALLGDHIVYLCGWIPKAYMEQVAEEVKNNYQEDEVIIEKTDAKEAKDKYPNIGKIPSLFWNNFVVKPFELLVTTYGYPGYDDIDPTLFVTFGFLLMFGIMFGDVGHGLVLLLSGLFLKFYKPFKNKEGIRNAGVILMGCGTISIIFGFLFGSLFAFEEILKPILFHTIDPNHINTLLISTVVIGILYLSLGVFLNIIQSFMKKKYFDALFGHYGLASLVFYWSLISIGVLMIKFEVSIPIVYILIPLIFLLMLILFKERISGLFQKNQNPKVPIVQELFGVIEIVMSYFSNTVSFVRVGAFALSHAAMGIAIFQINQVFKEMLNTGTVTDIVNIVSGNLLIITLEGMIASIQTIRLQYYEFFSKFYKGDGIKFNPISFD